MRYKMKNETLTAEIESFGAELKSIKSNATGVEYMWYGKPEYYKRTSPILFPFVGNLKNQEYTYEGKKYPMTQHGFARDMEFKVTEQKEDELWFLLVSDDSTLEKYPFSFELHIGYCLTANALKVTWKVVNTNEKEMHFSIGAHSEFNCPLQDESDKTGYGLDFHTGHEVLASRINADGLMLDRKQKIAEDAGKMLFPEGFFDDGVYIVENSQTNRVSLLDPKGREYVTVSSDAPLYGIWSPEKKNAPFVAIEPWYGRCDRATFAGTLEEREWGNHLMPHETFERSYEIAITE